MNITFLLKLKKKGKNMDYQTIYYLYDYCCRLATCYDNEWVTEEDYILYNQYKYLADFFEKELDKEN